MTAEVLRNCLKDVPPDTEIVWVDHDGYTCCPVSVEARVNEYGVKLAYLIWHYDGIGG